jgi:NitT/TauT family transport system substrate-binding protein
MGAITRSVVTGGLLLLLGQAALAADEVSVRLNWITGGTNIAWFLGMERGYFQKENIDLKVTDGRGSVIAAQLVANKSDLFGMSDGAAIALTASKGAPIKSVMSIRSASGYAVIFLKDSGIKTLKDLEGRRLAITAGDALTQQWPLIVKENKLDASKIKLTYMDAPAKSVALMEKRVDAMLGNFVDQGVLIKQKGFDVGFLKFSELGVNNVTMALAAHDDTIKNNPDLVRRFVRAASHTWADYKTDPKAATDAALKHKPELNAKLVLEQAVGNVDLMDSENTKGKTVGWHSAKDWTDTIDQLKELGQLKFDKPATAYYTNDFIPQ